MGATSGQPGRYQRSSSGMVGALLVTLLVIGAFVAFRACNRTDLVVDPEHVDYLTQVGFAQEAGDQVVYPASLPTGWFATQPFTMCSVFGSPYRLIIMPSIDWW